MDKSIKLMLQLLLNRHIIGAKHFPERLLIVSKTKWLSKDERILFEKEYSEIINRGLLLRMKKRTGKGTEWHISLNPEKLNDIYELMNYGKNQTRDVL